MLDKENQLEVSAKENPEINSGNTNGIYISRTPFLLTTGSVLTGLGLVLMGMAYYEATPLLYLPSVGFLLGGSLAYYKDI